MAAPELLLTAQAVAVALGALPVFWLARKHLRSETAALGFALAYLLYPPIQWATLSEFHPVVLSCPLLLYAIWFLDEERLAMFAVFAVLAALGKEEIGLVIAAAGIWYGVSHQRLRAGCGRSPSSAWRRRASPSTSSCPHFHEGPSPFLGRYRAVGGTPGGVLKNLVTDPGVVLGKAFDARGIRYLAGARSCRSPGSRLLAPLALLIAAPEIALNLLSSVTTQQSVEQHYAAGVTPGSWSRPCSARSGSSRYGQPAAIVASVAVAAGLVANLDLGALPWKHRVRELISVSAHDDAARRVLARVPAGAARKRDEHARRAPLGAAADPQLPEDGRRRLGGRRCKAAEHPRPREPGRGRHPCGRRAPARSALASGRLRRRRPALRQSGIACGKRYTDSAT